VTGVEPMTAVVEMKAKMRTDVVADGEIADAIVANAPAGAEHFFAVPKVVE
jgi:aspartyl-tRNA(Asn)/glutamyl-tRNA(Gln) amidotransferase subunit C